MKNFYLLLCFLATATFSYAQELTPDMLVGEYEGTAEVLYEGADETETDNKAQLKISKYSPDSCLLEFTYHKTPLKCFLIFKNESFSISFNEFKDFGGLTKKTSINHYEGDKIPSVKRLEYDGENEILKTSLERILIFEGRKNEERIRYFFFRMKKK